MKLWIKTLLRFAAGAYFVLTSLYCILAFLPYTFYFLIKAPAYSWMPWFVHHHAALYWAAALALLAANWNAHPRPSYRQWRLLAMVGFFLVSEIYLSIHPFLALLQNDGAAYYWSLASLLPLVLAMVFSRIELGFSHHSRSITARPFQYSGALLSAVIISVVYMIGAKLLASGRAHGTSFRAADADYVLWSLLSHIVLALLIFSVLNLVHVVASKARQSWQVQFAMNGVLIFGALWTVIFHFLGSALSFQGWASHLYSAALALTVTLWGHWLLCPLFRSANSCGNTEDEKSAPVGVWIILVACCALAIGFPHLIGDADWSGFLQSTLTLTLWIIVTACVFRLGSKQRSYSVAGVVGVVAISAFLYKGAQATGIFWSKSLGSTDDDISLKLEEYGGHDNSFQLAHHILGNSRNEVCGDLCRILRENTNVRDTRVHNDLQLVDQLTPTKGERPNIFVFVIDSMRPDYLGAYNSKVDFTPNLDAFARDSIVVRNAYSQYAGTSLSEPAIWSGAMLLHAHYLQPFFRVNSLERMLQVDKYRMVISADEVLGAILAPTDDMVRLDTDKKLWNELELGSTLRQTESFLDSRPNRSQPVFVYAQPKNVHQFARNDVPSLASQHWPERPGFHTRVTYEVHWVDSCFGEFFKYLKQRGMYDDSIIIVTSDHGDATGELGRTSHSTSIWPEIMRVPLIIHIPASMRERFVYDNTRLSTLTDITPTLYYLLGHHPIRQNPLYGRPLLTETAQEISSYPQRDLLLASDVRAVYGILTADGRYLYATYDSPAQSYLFDLLADPNAQHNVLTPTLKRRYDEEIIEHLQTIGNYYGYRPGIASLLASASH